MRPALEATERTCTRKNGTATERSVTMTVMATRISMSVKPDRGLRAARRAPADW